MAHPKAQMKNNGDKACSSDHAAQDVRQMFTYKGHLKSLWTHLITPSQNFVASDALLRMLLSLL
jgi:hypothetical protein